LNQDGIVEKIRLNSLFQLSRVNKTVTIKEIAKALNLNEDDSEVCVVKAI